MHHINSSNDKRLAIGYVKIKQYNYELLSYIFDKFMLFLLDGSAWFQCIIQIIMIIILCLHSLLRLPYKNSTSTCSKITCYHTCSHVITCDFGTCSCGIFVMANTASLHISSIGFKSITVSCVRSLQQPQIIFSFPFPIFVG